MKKISLWLCAAVLMVSCSKQITTEAPVVNQEVSAIPKNQLSASFQNWTKYFEGKTDATPVSYSNKGEIKTEADRTNLINRLLNDTTFVLNYTSDTTFNPVALKQVKNNSLEFWENEKTVSTTVLVSLKKALDTLVKVGQSYAEIKWSYKGKAITSLCVYNESGIVYDHFLTNVFIVKNNDEIKSLENTASTNLSTLSDLSTTASNRSATATVVNLQLCWIWGSPRGQVTIKHSIIYNTKIVTNSYSATAYLTIGSAGAQARSNALTSTYSKLAWAYGWASPTASFSIKFNYSKVEFSVSVSGLGSSGKGNGIHTCYL